MSTSAEVLANPGWDALGLNMRQQQEKERGLLTLPCNVRSTFFFNMGLVREPLHTLPQRVHV